MELDLYPPVATKLLEMQREFETELVNNVLESFVECGLDKNILNERMSFKINFILNCNAIKVERIKSFLVSSIDFIIQVKVNEVIYIDYGVATKLDLEGDKGQCTTLVHKFVYERGL